MNWDTNVHCFFSRQSLTENFWHVQLRKAHMFKKTTMCFNQVLTVVQEIRFWRKREKLSEKSKEKRQLSKTFLCKCTAATLVLGKCFTEVFAFWDSILELSATPILRLSLLNWTECFFVLNVQHLFVFLKLRFFYLWTCQNSKVHVRSKNLVKS